MEEKIQLGSRELTREQYVNILKSRKLIVEPKRYQLKVTQVGEYTPADGEPRKIVNLQATSKYHINRAKELIKEGDFQEALNQQFTYTIFINDGVLSGYLPSKGELVNAQFSYHTNKYGEEMLVVSQLSEIPITLAKSIDNEFDGLFETTNELEEIAADAKEELA